MFVNEIKRKFNINEPIFTEELMELFSQYSRPYVFRIINEMEKTNELVRYTKGVYFIPKKTFFGLSTITADSVVEKRYLKELNNVYGIYSGLKLLNLFSITTQVPNVVEIVTNNETMRCREIEVNGRKFILRKSRFEIDKNNADMYMLLQVFNDLDAKTKLDDFAQRRLTSFIKEKGINLSKLLNLAMKFPAKTMKNLIGSGVLNGIA
ncbi:MAG: hypothetical protein E7373_01705 [Clostridiales bacterium]|nr:hypothetical protein [Clostridiales bacterium]